MWSFVELWRVLGGGGGVSTSRGRTLTEPMSRAASQKPMRNRRVPRKKKNADKRVKKFEDFIPPPPTYFLSLHRQSTVKLFSPVVRVHGDGSRLAQLSGDQHFPLPAVSAGDGDALVARVGPVNVLVDPVDGQALGGVERVNKRYLLRRVAGLVDVRAKGEEERRFVSCQSAGKRSRIRRGGEQQEEKRKEEKKRRSKYCIFFLSKQGDQVWIKLRRGKKTFSLLSQCLPGRQTVFILSADKPPWKHLALYFASLSLLSEFHPRFSALSLPARLLLRTFTYCLWKGFNFTAWRFTSQLRGERLKSRQRCSESMQTRQSGDLLFATADIHWATMLLQIIQGFCFICLAFWNKSTQVLLGSRGMAQNWRAHRWFNHAELLNFGVRFGGAKKDFAPYSQYRQ